jgi:hypothetical protein
MTVHVELNDPDGIKHYFFKDMGLVLQSFALTYHAVAGQISFEKQPDGAELVIYTNSQGVRSHIARVVDITVHGIVRDRAEHF